MSVRDTRTLALVVVGVIAAVMILNPNWLRFALDTVQSVVIIVLGIVATIYLWKRL